MKERESQDRFIERIRLELDGSAQGLDPGTLSRLKQARKKALDAASAEAVRPRRWLGIPAAGLAAVAVAILVVLIHFDRPTIPLPAQHLEALEILGSRDDLDLFRDMEFYAWLSEEESYVG